MHLRILICTFDTVVSINPQYPKENRQENRFIGQKVSHFGGLFWPPSRRSLDLSVPERTSVCQCCVQGPNRSVVSLGGSPRVWSI